MKRTGDARTQCFRTRKPSGFLDKNLEDDYSRAHDVVENEHDDVDLERAKSRAGGLFWDVSS